MKLADFAKGAATFLVAIAAGFLSTSYVDRYFGEPKLSKWATSGPSACVSADWSWKNWPWPNVPALSPKCKDGN